MPILFDDKAIRNFENAKLLMSLNIRLKCIFVLLSVRIISKKG